MAVRRGTSATMTMLLLSICIGFRAALGVELWAVTDWTSGAHATFYGGQDTSGTMGGACGYGDLYSTGYGTKSTALSNPLFNNGLTCGACFQIQCVLSESAYCFPGGKTITVTATNACPPGSEGGWCDDKPHFDLSYPMFTTLAQAVGGVFPVLYKRVSCTKQGGIRFTINGNPYFDYVLVTNVAGDGTIQSLYIQGDGAWNSMSQNWGAYWQSGANLVGQSLSFRVLSGTGKEVYFSSVASAGWKFGQTYEADGNM